MSQIEKSSRPPAAEKWGSGVFRAGVRAGWIGSVAVGLTGLLPGCVIVFELPGDSFGDDEAFEDSGPSTFEDSAFEESSSSSGFEEDGFEVTTFGDTGFDTVFETGFDTVFDTGFDTFETGFDTVFDTGFESGYETGFETGGFEESGSSESGSDTDTGGELCDLPVLHVRRSLIETNPEALAGITMASLLTQSAIGADVTADPQFTFTRLFDSFANGAGGELPGGARCDDAIVEGQASLNGYPLQCPRIESLQVGAIEQWFPIAAVNRFDLAPADGGNCGEQRIIMASGAVGRAFAIFEAQIPNPSPECGLAACLPLVEFWAEIGQNADPAARAEQIRMAFLDGHPELGAAGFEPFMTGVNMTLGTGQIRTNSLDDDPWTLREFSFVTDEGRLGVIPTPVTNNSFGPLWNDLDPLAHGEVCRQAILDGMPKLLLDNVSKMGLFMPLECQAAESRDDENTDYAGWLAAGSGEFEASLASRLADLGSELSPAELANRAEFASNCMGCHQSGTGEDLGNGVVSPGSGGFVHVDESFTESCGAGQTCFVLSPALTEEFLPHRRQVMIDFLNGIDCTGSCGPGSEPSEPAVHALVDGPATLGLPDIAQPIEALLAWEAAYEADFADVTLGGQPRGSH